MAAAHCRATIQPGGGMATEPSNGGDSGKEILTIEELAGYLRLKPQTIYKWAQGNRIPAAKLGKEWRFLKRNNDSCLCGQGLAADPEAVAPKKLCFGAEGEDGARFACPLRRCPPSLC